MTDPTRICAEAAGEPTARDGLPAPRHVPVLLAEVMQALAPVAGDTIVDATFGAGGYSGAILAIGGTRVLALDRDPTAIASAGPLLAQAQGRLTLVEQSFAAIEAAAAEHGLTAGAVAGVVLDIGISSMQIDDPARGFSFTADGPLDMRMSGAGVSAADIVNSADEAVLADIFFHLGEERRARQIARAIVKARESAAIATTGALVRIVERVLGRQRGDDKHPATRTFQALRIAVNDELGELAAALVGAERLLAPGGRLVVVTFHSLEDRIVKRFLARRGGREGPGSRHGPPRSDPTHDPSFRIVNQRPLTPGQEEIAANPRARSAKLRAAVRTQAAAFAPEDPRDLGIPRLETDPRR